MSRAFTLSMLASIGLLSMPHAPMAESFEEDKVKAAYLLNFSRYIEWPADSFSGPSSAFVVCVLGDEALTKTTAQLIGGRKTDKRIVAVRNALTVSDAKSCHILYVPISQQSRQSELLAALAGESVFVISEFEGFAEMGGVANFTRQGQKLRFEINHAAAKKANLKLSAQLLRIAIVVG